MESAFRATACWVASDAISTWADDPSNDENMVITTYEPDPKEWEPDLKTRRKP